MTQTTHQRRHAPREELLSRPQSIKTLFLTLMPFAMLASLATLIFWHLPGVTQYDPDDYWVIKLLPKLKLPHDFHTYIGFMGGRNFELWLSHQTLVWTNFNTDGLVIAGVVLYALSSMILFAVLRRTFSTKASLAGAALYLCHPIKWHAVLTFNAQLYIAVELAAIGMLGILSSRMKQGIQCAIILPTLWVGLHIYEVIGLLVPIIPLFWLGQPIARKQVPHWRSIVYSALPIAITITHLKFLSMKTSPLWNRNLPGDPNYLAKIPSHVFEIFSNGISKLFGFEHVKTLTDFFHNFIKFDLRTDQTLLIPLFIATAATLITIVVLCRANSESESALELSTDTRVRRYCFLGAGLFFTLFGPLLALPCSLSDVPSRLLFMPTLGLALVVCAGLDLFAPKNIKTPLFIGAILLCMLEAIAFCDTTQQLITASAVDKKIIAALRTYPNLQLQPGSQVFISLPFDQRRVLYWTIEPPNFYHSPVPARLWDTYGLRQNNIGRCITYSSVMRYPKTYGPWGLHSWLRSTLPKAKANTLYPFYLDDRGSLHPIAKATLLGRDDDHHTIVLGPHGKVSDDDTMEVTCEPDQAIVPLFWNIRLPIPTSLPCMQQGRP